MQRFLPFILLIAAAPALQAQWTGTAELGYSASSGNSSAEALYLAATVTHQQALNTLKLTGHADRQRSDGALSKDLYLIEGQFSHFLTEQRHTYLYTNGLYERDEPSGLVSRYNVTVGPGWRWPLTQRTAFDAELGAGWHNDDFTDPSRDADGWMGRLYLKGTHVFNKAVKGQLETTERYDADRRLNTTRLSVESALNSHLSLSAQYEYRYNSKSEADKRNEDTLTRLTLKYVF